MAVSIYQSINLSIYPIIPIIWLKSLTVSATTLVSFGCHWPLRRTRGWSPIGFQKCLATSLCESFSQIFLVNQLYKHACLYGHTWNYTWNYTWPVIPAKIWSCHLIKWQHIIIIVTYCYAYIYTHMYVCMYVFIYIYTYMSYSVWICFAVCINAYLERTNIYIYIYI